MKNRFELLNLDDDDGEEDSVEDDDEFNHSGMSLPSEVLGTRRRLY